MGLLGMGRSFLPLGRDPRLRWSLPDRSVRRRGGRGRRAGGRSRLAARRSTARDRRSTSPRSRHSRAIRPASSGPSPAGAGSRRGAGARGPPRRTRGSRSLAGEPAGGSRPTRTSARPTARSRPARRARRPSSIVTTRHPGPYTFESLEGQDLARSSRCRPSVGLSFGHATRADRSWRVLRRLSRYLVDGAVSDRTGGEFPWGTLASRHGLVALGLLFAMATERAILPAKIRGPVMMSFIGG